MKLRRRYKLTLSLLAMITVVVLCALPFFMMKKETIYVYTKSIYADSKENGFIRELKQLGYRVKVNDKQADNHNAVAVWFRNPGVVNNVFQSSLRHNFLYDEEYRPLNENQALNFPVILTPYQALYEHYVRSNIKTALFNLGINTADYSPQSSKKNYDVVYVGDNNKYSPVAEWLKEQSRVHFLGRFWTGLAASRILKYDSDKERGKYLAQIKQVIVYNPDDSSDSYKIPTEIIEATSAGALVFSSPNKQVSKYYGESVIIYQSIEELQSQLSYYQHSPELAKNKAEQAQKITLNKLTSTNAAQRLKEIIDWMKK